MHSITAQIETLAAHGLTVQNDGSGTLRTSVRCRCSATQTVHSYITTGTLQPEPMATLVVLGWRRTSSTWAWVCCGSCEQSARTQASTEQEHSIDASGDPNNPRLRWATEAPRLATGPHESKALRRREITAVCSVCAATSGVEQSDSGTGEFPDPQPVLAALGWVTPTTCSKRCEHIRASSRGPANIPVEVKPVTKLPPNFFKAAKAEATKLEDREMPAAKRAIR